MLCLWPGHHRPRGTTDSDKYCRLYSVMFRQTTQAATPSTLERTRKCTTTGDNDYDNDEDRDDDTMMTPSCDLMDRAVAGNTERGGQVSCDWSTGHNTDL